MNRNIAEATEAAPILFQVAHQVIFHPDIPAFPPHILTDGMCWPALLACTSAAHAAYVLTDTAAPDTAKEAAIRRSKLNSNRTRPMYGQSSTPRITASPDGDITSMASYGESDGNAEYVKSPKNWRTRSSNTPELKGRIQ